MKGSKKRTKHEWEPKKGRRVRPVSSWNKIMGEAYYPEIQEDQEEGKEDRNFLVLRDFAPEDILPIG